ncbi:hypothetical protein UPYG_G00319410 [Umbra pygmaea]|uniref:Transposase n=1 Tax=Umbra pygmaea TaxID=75934 RepID=A0ABD0W0C0_UMBPY
MHKIHHRLDFHFLIAGHTKFAPEWFFGLIKQRFRKTRLNTSSDIAVVVKDSTLTGVNIPQLTTATYQAVPALQFDVQQPAVVFAKGCFTWT